MLSIQLSFTCFVYPAVVLAYLGQGARLIVDGEAVLSNLFYQTIPGSANGPLYWSVVGFVVLKEANRRYRIMFVFGILATVSYIVTLFRS